MPRGRSLLEPRRVPWLVGLVLVAVGLLTLSFDPVRDTRLWRAVFDAAHLPLFMALGWLLGWSLRNRGRWSLGAAALLVGALAVGTEALQVPGSRDASWQDLIWNGVGGFLGLAIAGASLRRDGRPARALTAVLAALGIGLFAVAARPAAFEVGGWIRSRLLFPVLGDFESGLDLAIWRGVAGARARRTEAWSADGRWSLEIEPGRARFAGAGIEDRSHDWSGWDTLAVWASGAAAPASGANPAGDTLEIVVRVDDDGPSSETKDRYNETFRVPASGTRIAIPLEAIAGAPAGRRLRLARIRRLLIFESDRVAPRPFRIDGVRLVRHAAPPPSG